jgi:hypothetical protein
MVRIRTLATSSILFIAACTSSSSPPVGPDVPGDGESVSPPEQTAVSLGMSILSTDAAGSPRLMRSIRPRPSAPGMTPELAARDHLAALTPIWLPTGRAMALASQGTQELRGGATVVKLVQQVDGVIVDQSDMRVLMHADGSLAAVSGTVLPAAPSPRFVSSPREALDRALDQLHGASRARPAITERGDRAGWQMLEVVPDPALRVN